MRKPNHIQELENKLEDVQIKLYALSSRVDESTRLVKIFTSLLQELVAIKKEEKTR